MFMARGVSGGVAALAFVCLWPALAAGAPFELEPGLEVLEPIQFRQVAVFPVVARNVEGGPELLTLAAGLEQKLVRVREMADGGDVNRVRVTNRSKKPLLLLGGEIILGGQQDRVLSGDTIIAPGKTEVVAVFCVERGRWGGRAEFNRSGGMAEGKVRLRAKYQKNQAAVWDEVAQKVNALGARSATGTYRTVAVGERGDAKLAPYRDLLQRPLEAHALRGSMVGLVAAINGAVYSVDVFATPQLFAEYRGRILQALFVTAADREPKPGVAAPGEGEIKAFVQAADAAPETVEERKPSSTTSKKDSARVLNTSVATPAPGGSKDVYRSYQLKE